MCPAVSLWSRWVQSGCAQAPSSRPEGDLCEVASASEPAPARCGPGVCGTHGLPSVRIPEELKRDTYSQHPLQASR